MANTIVFLLGIHTIRMADETTLPEGTNSETTADETAEQTQDEGEPDELTLYKQQLEEERQKNKRLYSSLGKVNKRVEELESKTINGREDGQEQNFDADYIKRVVTEQTEHLRSERLREKQKDAFLKANPDAWDYIDRVEKISKGLDLSFEDAYHIANPSSMLSTVQAQSTSVKMPGSVGSSGQKTIDKMSKEEKMKEAAKYLDSLGEKN